MDEQLTFAERQFFYMPLMHAEDRDLQALSLERFDALREAAEAVLGFASGHRKIVYRFGRFPHRNKVLGRASSPEEEAFLASDENTFRYRPISATRRTRPGRATRASRTARGRARDARRRRSRRCCARRRWRRTGASPARRSADRCRVGVRPVDQDRRGARRQPLLNAERVRQPNGHVVEPGVAGKRDRAACRADRRDRRPRCGVVIVPRNSSAAAACSAGANAAIRAACGRRAITPQRGL